jgi:predicted phage baseplate assembly protein
VHLSSADARDYIVQRDEKGQVWILFGDGVYGRRPPAGTNNIRASYHVGGGRKGNVPAGAITKALTQLSHLSAVTNPLAAAGGEDAESNEHAARFGPLSFRSLQRAVTLDDYVALTFQAGGVAKVRARSGAWNTVELVVAPEGERCGPVPESLRVRLLAYFENKRMAGTSVRIFDPGCALVDVGLDVLIDAHYQLESVRQSVIAAITGMLAFANVDFGQTIYQSDVYALIEAVPGVLAVSLTRFRRVDSPLVEIEDELRKANLPPLGQLPAIVREALEIRRATEGRIEVGPFEIPVLGDLDVVLRTAAQ